MQKPSEMNRRKFTRIPIEASVRLTNASGKWTCELIDISLQGMLTTVPENWQVRPGEPFMIELVIENDKSKIHMNGSIVRIGTTSVAFKAQHMGESSIVNLTKIVKNNIGDTEILERELSAFFC